MNAPAPAIMTLLLTAYPLCVLIGIYVGAQALLERRRVAAACVRVA